MAQKVYQGSSDSPKQRDLAWGQMGLQAEITNKVNEQVPNGTTVDKKGIAPAETASQGCCQGAAGFSCCRDESAEEKEVEKKGQGRFPICFRKWDKPEVFTSIGVVGAVAFIAVAYGFYKKSH
ncbi:hypothetical protein K7X08_033602 [Anisodus acutangulus]|uniref:Transmembrane protein n=1 Tax=Anisodus acutangulus TaxID=402998 RepID=A0A9Q1M2Y3_9SOLA|nr:hypothetical protein K7X08_033602 [Anisodus acutangulus]